MLPCLMLSPCTIELARQLAISPPRRHTPRPPLPSSTTIPHSYSQETLSHAHNFVKPAVHPGTASAASHTPDDSDSTMGIVSTSPCPRLGA